VSLGDLRAFGNLLTDWIKQFLQVAGLSWLSLHWQKCHCRLLVDKNPEHFIRALIYDFQTAGPVGPARRVQESVAQ
jgi:hypothetical protein